MLYDLVRIPGLSRVTPWSYSVQIKTRGGLLRSVPGGDVSNAGSNTKSPSPPLTANLASHTVLMWIYFQDTGDKYRYTPNPTQNLSVHTQEYR